MSTGFFDSSKRAQSGSEAATRRGFIGVRSLLNPVPSPRRLLLALALAVAASVPGTLGEATRLSLVSAYVGVSVFVAATLFMFYAAEKVFHFDLGQSLKRAAWAQIPIASFMGALPGCGGAVVVVAAYSAGNISMGAVVAALTATMGDAAFLLIATRPDAAALLLPVSFSVGIVSGYVVDRIHKEPTSVKSGGTCEISPLIGRLRKRDLLYAAIAVPGLVLGGFNLAQVDPVTVFGSSANVLPLVGIAVGIAVWSVSPIKATTHTKDHPLTRMTEETSFISAWVVLAFLLYEYTVAFAGLDLAALFETVAPALPMVAILIGFIPGCGPQVLVTTLYINGLIPFAALLGNAISNDGDALFPAIALNPKAAIYATAYSAVPAFIMAYAFYFFAPGVL